MKNLKIIQESKLRRMKNWFIKLRFWKKILMISALNSLILLIIANTIMLWQFKRVADDVQLVTDADRNQYNMIANTQIAGSVAKSIISKFDQYANYLNLLLNAFVYFPLHQDYITSNEIDGQLPRLTSEFLTPSYIESAVYLGNKNSVKYNLAFVDYLLSNLMTDSTEIKRINFYVQNATKDASNFTVNTIPGTNDFTLKDAKIIKKKASILQKNSYSVSESYSDFLTKSSNPQKLISMVIGSKTSQYVTMIEIEIHAEVISNMLKNIYYLPSTYIMLVKNNGTHKVLISQNTQPSFYANLDQFYSIGTHSIIIDGQLYLTATVAMADHYTIGVSSSVTNNETDPFRCIVLVKASEAQQPSLDLASFLANQQSILRGIILSWSFIIFLSTVGLAVVMGNYIFESLQLLINNIKEYIKQPDKFHPIVISFKQLEITGALKKLINNVIKIFEKIETRKRQQKNRISLNYNPFNIGEPKFQLRQQLNDSKIISEIKKEMQVNSSKKEEIMKKYNEG